MKSARCRLAALLLLAALPAGAQEITWNSESFNPRPLEGDLVLPMPCGGAMAFRKVNVPGSGALDDYRVTLGSHETDRGFAEYRRIAWLAGAFAAAGGGGSRHYYLGKYEVTAMQRAALGETCPDAANPDLELPATEISWAEAMLFAERYSEWLLRNAVGLVPAEEGAVGFLRLPTEAEWEFAARGGTAVGPAEFAERTFVPPGRLDEFVIHDGNSYRELNLIGTVQPNPLGLFDMLGNAAELALEPFRLNAVSHLHGQAGGFVLRGGSYLTRAGEIRTSHREEYPPVDEHGIRRQKTAGFRLALVAPALPSRDRIETVRKAWENLPQEDRNPDGEGAKLAAEQADPVEEARALAEAAPNGEMKRRLENLSFVIAESIRTRNQERDRAARELLSNAVFAARRATFDIVAFQRWKALADAVDDEARKARYMENHAEDYATFEFNLGYYLDRLTRIADDFGQEKLNGQAAVLKVEYADRGLRTLPPLTDRVLGHLEKIRSLGTGARPAIIQSLTDAAANAGK
ncbi:formylglycine-generating enzyme family protein [Minwuia thermotolerans]|uniref:Sulfatase-modifying factor enzyme-like domain-containing protein n=1 Tax=Minwuia thermotolerans TaxID=2056226 RepID=A0A2M9FW69_9PROT|nr:SUMF1/EgtB/PvdO family nonheme iron enzyme [Minwuia thermotolerans]PJK27715.1 hypothetical protein CVT23_20715 [Minwuia thermotolerans]